MKLSGITTIVWDVDNTLYPYNPALDREVKAAEITVICHHTKWPESKAREEMNKICGTKFVSSTAASAYLSHISVAQAAIEMETHIKRANYHAFDQKLVDMFSHLNSFTHYIFSNGGSEGIRTYLKILGLKDTQFAGIVTSEITGVNKPDPAGFLFIMDKTGKRPSSHLMIGDRERVDIEPAKKLAWKTCFVWGTSTIADVSVPTVYDVPTVLA